MSDAAPPSNRDFLLRHAATGRIGLCGGDDVLGKAIRKAQAPLTGHRHRSLWSHAFLIGERRGDGHWWVIESDLDLRYKHVRLGVQENRLERYFDGAAFPNVAVLDFGLDDAQTTQVLGAALDLLSGQPHYSVSELLGTLLAMPSSRLRRRRNPLGRERALFCSAMVRHCYAAAGVDLHAGIDAKHVTPNDLDTSPLAHTGYRLIRDPGISRLRRLMHAAGDVLGLSAEHAAAAERLAAPAQPIDADPRLD